MARRHRMTPRRRAALKKAQAASARKRRRRAVGSTFRAVGAVGATIGGAFVAYHTQRYIARPDHAVREARAAGRAVGRAGKSVGRKIRGGQSVKSGTKAKQQNHGDWRRMGYL